MHRTLQTTDLWMLASWMNWAQRTFNHVMDVMYGTPARTRITLFTLLGSLAAVKLLETFFAVPYCGI